MSRPVLFRREASRDVEQARTWYEARQEGLGRRFTEALKLVVDLISEHPLACCVVYRELRRALLPGFPYALFYLVGTDCIRVVACLHHRRGPETLAKRTTGLGTG